MKPLKFINRINNVKKVFFPYCFLILSCLIFVFSCGEDKQEPQVEQPLPKISLPIAQVSGLKINGKDLKDIAQNPPDTEKLDEQDLMKVFGIKNSKYLYQVMQKIQQQVESGKPLKSISLHFGKQSHREGLGCALKDEANQCWTPVVAFDCESVLPEENWTEANYNKICQSLGKLKLQIDLSSKVAIVSGEGGLWPTTISENIFHSLVHSEKIKWEKGKLETLSFFSPQTSVETTEAADAVGNSKAREAATSSTETATSPIDYYRSIKEKYGYHWAYFFATQSYRGRTLREIHQLWEQNMGAGNPPEAYKEMVQLLRYLHSQGIFVVVYNADPLFFTLPMIQRLSLGIPLYQSIGMDVALKDPENPQSVKSMQQLLNAGIRKSTTQEFKSFTHYDEFLTQYGHWIVADVRPPIDLPANKIKSVVRQYLKSMPEKGAKETSLTIDDFRTLFIAGGHFKSSQQKDFISQPPLQPIFVSGDQSFLEVFPLAQSPYEKNHGATLIWIQAWKANAVKSYAPYTQNQEDFASFWKEQKSLHHPSLGEPLVQMALAKSDTAEEKLGFRKEMQSKTQPVSPVPESQTGPDAGESGGLSPSPGSEPSPVPLGPAPVDLPLPSPPMPAAPQPAVPAPPSSPGSSPMTQPGQLPPLPPLP